VCEREPRGTAATEVEEVARGSFNRRGEIGGFDVVLLLALQFFVILFHVQANGRTVISGAHSFPPQRLVFSGSDGRKRLCPQQIVDWIPRRRFSGSSIELTRPACYSAPKVNSSPAI